MNYDDDELTVSSEEDYIKEKGNPKRLKESKGIGVDIENCNGAIVNSPLTDFLSPKGLEARGLITLNSDGILMVDEDVAGENLEEENNDSAEENDELILMDEAEHAERENRMAGTEDAQIVEEQKKQEEEIERQVSMLACQKKEQ